MTPFQNRVVGINHGLSTLRAEVKRVDELEGLLREAIPGLQNYEQGSDTADLVRRIKATLP